MTIQTRITQARRLLASVEKDHTPAVFSSSFGAEDMVVLDLIARDGLAIDIVTLDTGRLPRETHDLIEEVRRCYWLEIGVYAPWPGAIDAYIEHFGIDGFYEGLEQRRACCTLRKLEPLRRALAGKRGWVTGLRREQAETRAELAESVFDTGYGLWKFSPLADWSSEEVWQYLRQHHVPYNALHDRGYPSIGCEPCTRAVKPGEHPRAGRWWWEQKGAHKECGLHEIPIKVMEKV